nr:ankyrin repeat domain-containing protein [cyanobacterium endosymbiont of Epithemia turgida]
MEAGADVNPTNEDRTPALMIAAYEGHLAIPKTLIAAGSEVNLKDKDGDTPLNLAIKTHYQEIILALLNAGANFSDIVDKQKAVYFGNSCVLLINILNTMMPTFGKF